MKLPVLSDVHPPPQLASMVGGDGSVLVHKYCILQVLRAVRWLVC